MQETQVPSLSREDPTCPSAAKSTCAAAVPCTLRAGAQQEKPCVRSPLPAAGAEPQSATTREKPAQDPAQPEIKINKQNLKKKKMRVPKFFCLDII